MENSTICNSNSEAINKICAKIKRPADYIQQVFSLNQEWFLLSHLDLYNMLNRFGIERDE